jgi:hypothetical protein
MAGGVWLTYSPYETFTIDGANRGHWTGTGLDFYVAPNRASVDDFSIYISVSGCGSYKVTHASLIPILNGKFKFTGPFHANGTFSSTTGVHGLLGLNSYYIPGCGYVSGGPYSWSAAWASTGQPEPGVVAPSFLLLPRLDRPFPEAFRLDPQP